MSSENNPIFGGGLRPTSNAALEESGAFGAHRRWTNINIYEVIFLISGLLAALVTDGLTIYRLVKSSDAADADFAYGIILLATSIFLLIFLVTGILQQRITDIVVFFCCALMMTIYVIAHYVYRSNRPLNGETQTDRNLRLIRLIFTCVFNVIFVPLSIIVIRHYERDEFAKRLFGAFPAARWPLRIYNILDCIARINTMLSISVYLLNLYNVNEFEKADRVLLSIGIPMCFLWLGVTIGMIRLEKYVLVIFFLIISIFQPGFVIYCAISNVDNLSTTTATSAITPSSTSATIVHNTTTSHNESAIVLSDFDAENAGALWQSSTSPPTHISVPIALYVCLGLNLASHLASLVCAFMCVKNFGKGLKEKVFNNRLDKWFRELFSKIK